MHFVTNSVKRGLADAANMLADTRKQGHAKSTLLTARSAQQEFANKVCSATNSVAQWFAETACLNGIGCSLRAAFLSVSPICCANGFGQRLMSATCRPATLIRCARGVVQVVTHAVLDCAAMST